MPKLPIAQILAANLERILEERGVKAQWVADKTGQSTATISDIKRGLASPRIETLAEIAEVLDVPLFELLVDTEELRERTYKRAMERQPLAKFTPAQLQPTRLERRAAARRSKKGVKNEGDTAS